MTQTETVRVPPGRWWGNHSSETRWLLEAARLTADPVWHGRGGLPRGDGRAVVLVPGFLGGDYTLAPLARWLLRIGYRAARCGFVTNADCSERALERVERRVAAEHARTGRRVAIVGHSRGGHFARAVAARRPDLVSHALSLGADLQAMFLQRAHPARGRGGAPHGAGHRPRAPSRVPHVSLPVRVRRRLHRAVP